jgi:Phage tail protein (Tail_P2_I)
MPDRSNEFRKLATDCVAIARDVTDPVARATLLTMAQTWYDMANGAAINPDSLVRKFNDHKSVTGRRSSSWEISRIKGTPAAILGRIKATDAESAVKEWIEKFDITDP